MSNLKHLNNLLQDEDPAVRFNAGLDLVKSGNPAGIPPLIEAFSHDSQVVRLFYAGPALADLGQPAVSALEEALTSESLQVRVDAAITLLSIDKNRLNQLMPIVLPALSANEPHAKQDALRFLSQIDNSAAKKAVPALLEALHAPQDVADPQAWLLDIRIWLAALLAKIADPLAEIVASLIALLNSKDDAVRWGVVRALGDMGTSAQMVVPALINTAQNEAENETVRVEAAYSLTVIAEPDTETLPVIRNMAKSHDWWVRTYAARILGQMGAPPSQEPPSAARWEEAVFLSRRTPRRVRDATLNIMPILLQTLADPNYNVRRNSVYALAQLEEKAKAAIPALIASLSTIDIGPIAAEALAKIGDTALPALVEALTSSDEQTQHHAAYALTISANNTAKAALTKTNVVPFQPQFKHFYTHIDVDLDETKTKAFEALYQETLQQGLGREVNYTLPYPKHEFLHYLVVSKGLLTHGSGKTDIDILRPFRWGIDSAAHGNVSGVYAEKGYMRPIYFAVINNQRCYGQHNGFIDVNETGERSEQEDLGRYHRFYKLTIGSQGLRRNPWQAGMVYILPPDTFEYWHEWTSRVPVQPLLKLAVDPADFPLRDQVWGIDRRQSGPTWVDLDMPFPFLEDTKSIAIHPGGYAAWAAPELKKRES